jgi:ROS/MUCR transcriptional regulator protein
MMRRPIPPPFKTRHDIERYFSDDTIECLMCGRHLQRLHSHLNSKHGMTADEYKSKFGLPWSRGLTSAASTANSGWTEERKRRARKLALKNRFFESAHSVPKRELAPFLKVEAAEHLGAAAKPYGKAFDQRVSALVAKGLGYRAIARALRVAHATVLKRDKQRHKSKPKR